MVRHAAQYCGPEPEGAPLEEQGLGWTNSFGTGKGGDAITSGLEGAWTSNPVKWDNGYFENLFGYEWELTKSPAGAFQWIPRIRPRRDTVPDAHDPSKRHAPMMFTTDLALRMDPIYAPISKRFHENPDEFADAFAKAWYKLTHRDMGPVSRFLGPLVPPPQLWQDPVPAVDHELIGAQDIATLKAKILASGLSDLATGDDRLGFGVHVPRHRQARWRERGAHSPGAAEGLGSQPTGRAREGPAGPRENPEGVQRPQSGEKKVSLADLIVLGGCAAVEAAAKKAGHDVQVPFAPGAPTRRRR